MKTGSLPVMPARFDPAPHDRDGGDMAAFGSRALRSGGQQIAPQPVPPDPVARRRFQHRRPEPIVIAPGRSGGDVRSEYPDAGLLSKSGMMAIAGGVSLFLLGARPDAAMMLLVFGLIFVMVAKVVEDDTSPAAPPWQPLN